MNSSFNSSSSISISISSTIEQETATTITGHVALESFGGALPADLWTVRSAAC